MKKCQNYLLEGVVNRIMGKHEYEVKNMNLIYFSAIMKKVLGLQFIDKERPKSEEQIDSLYLTRKLGRRRK